MCYNHSRVCLVFRVALSLCVWPNGLDNPRAHFRPKARPVLRTILNLDGGDGVVNHLNLTFSLQVIDQCEVQLYLVFLAKTLSSLSVII